MIIITIPAGSESARQRVRVAQVPLVAGHSSWADSDCQSQCGHAQAATAGLPSSIYIYIYIYIISTVPRAGYWRPPSRRQPRRPGQRRLVRVKQVQRRRRHRSCEAPAAAVRTVGRPRLAEPARAQQGQGRGPGGRSGGVPSHSNLNLPVKGDLRGLSESSDQDILPESESLGGLVTGRAANSGSGHDGSPGRWFS
jgi:hypothetical protein